MIEDRTDTWDQHRVSEAEVHRRRFLGWLVERELHGLVMITSDAHTGLKAAREAVFPTVKWQRCQFYLHQNAGHHVARQTIRPELAHKLRTVFIAPSL